MRIPFHETDPWGRPPKKATSHAAGYDLICLDKVELVPHGRALVDTGFSLAIPEGYAGLILPRSGLALKKGLTVLNAPGLIDPDYRGSIKVLLWNSNDEGTVVEVSAGDRIAQLVIVKTETVEFSPVAVLPSTGRGAGGFGSTGVTDLGPGGEAA